MDAHSRRTILVVGDASAAEAENREHAVGKAIPAARRGRPLQRVEMYIVISKPKR
jgi:hypothetical protein